jgi:hypothetical protein
MSKRLVAHFANPDRSRETRVYSAGTARMFLVRLYVDGVLYDPADYESAYGLGRGEKRAALLDAVGTARHMVGPDAICIREAIG